MGCELEDKYFKICEDRIDNTIEGSSLIEEPTKEENPLF